MSKKEITLSSLPTTLKINLFKTSKEKNGKISLKLS
jgi:hypothetical protein